MRAARVPASTPSLHARVQAHAFMAQTERATAGGVIVSRSVVTRRGNHEHFGRSAVVVVVVYGEGSDRPQRPSVSTVITVIITQRWRCSVRVNKKGPALMVVVV